MNTFSQVMPMLMTNDMAATKTFWCDVFGFECKGEMSEQWMSLDRDKTTIMFCAPNEHMTWPAEPTMSGSVYFVVADVDALWNEINTKAEVCYPIESFDYGMREFAVYDNNGYLVQFGTDLQK